MSFKKLKLRAVLITWFLTLSVIPLLVIVFFSLITYKKSLNEELSYRLEGVVRELQTEVEHSSQSMTRGLRGISNDLRITYPLVRNQKKALSLAVVDILNDHGVDDVFVFSKRKNFLVSYQKNLKKAVSSQNFFKKNEISIQDKKRDIKTFFINYFFIKNKIKLMKKLKRETSYFLNINEQGGVAGLSLIGIRSVYFRSIHAGFVAFSVFFDSSFFKRIESSLGMKIVFPKQDRFFINGQLLHFGNDGGVLNLDIDSMPYGFLKKNLVWKGQELNLAVGANISSMKKIVSSLHRVSFGSVFFLVVCLLILSFVISKMILKPLESLTRSVQDIDFTKSDLKLDAQVSGSEFNLLFDKFNTLLVKVKNSQEALEQKVQQLDQAYSRLKKAQAQLVQSEKMASLGQLVAGVAHELNNPIGFIYGNLFFLENHVTQLLKWADKLDGVELEETKKELPKIMTSIKEGASRSKDIVLGLKTFASPSEGEKKKFDILKNVETCVSFVKGALGEDVQINIRCSNKELSVQADVTHMNQVFINLLTNAVQSMSKKGEVEIHVVEGFFNFEDLQKDPFRQTSLIDLVSKDHWEGGVVKETATSRSDGKEGFDSVNNASFDEGSVVHKTTAKSMRRGVMVSFKDRGLGIEQESLRQIFDPFFTTKQTGEGMGLGLSISFGILKDHGGALCVHSVEGQGSEFGVFLPI